MGYRIALNFEDGTTRFITCKDGEKVLDAAYRQKINLPMDCADGVCGTCKCRCEHGVYDLGDDYIEDALNKSEAEDGFVLTCQMIPSSDCMIAVPVPSTACKVSPDEYAATVHSVELVSDRTIILKLKLDNPETLNFLAGQYVNLAVPGAGQHRTFSLSSKPGTAEVSFLIRNVPGGLMSGWLTKDAAPGARMRFVGPNGSFYLRPVNRPVLMLASGTGLAPILSMIEVLADEECDQSIHLVYGVSKETDLVEIDRLEVLAGRLADFTYITCVSDPASLHPRKGYVTSHLEEHYPYEGNCDAYLCGPPAMVENARRELRALKRPPVRLFYEKFTATELVPA